MGQPVLPPPSDGIESVELKTALEERYYAYALSTIMQRALPDARDGLKPVHRRILYGMRLLRLDPTSAFKKCAKIVGDVMGDFHPHGDQAIYDALVRLSQDFAQRYPLVDGQGNFGNIDGDGPAAYRYTEARLTEVARLLLDGIDEDTVDFRASYNGEKEEPIVLPAAFPNLLANGSQGIAVGMATSIPPHNAAELCDAALYLIQNREATSEQLCTFVQGPDFPTGGILIDSAESIREAYRTGRGGFRVRARWAKEDLGRGTWNIVVTEIPYGVPKARLIEKLADLLQEKKLPLLADVRDESAEDVRVVLEPRSRSVDPVMLMESLFRLSELESRIPLNLNVLVGGVVPRVIGLAECLREWVDHRRVVLQRRSSYRLGQIERRLEILGGLLIVYLDLDEVIRIIREEDEPKAALMARFELTEVQANAILDTRLRSLRKLEEMELKREFEALTAEKEGIEGLLASEKLQWTEITKQIRAVKKTFGPETKLGRRRTTLENPPDTAGIDFTAAMVEREPITVILSEKGWIRALKGHVADLSGVTFKGDDTLKVAFLSETTAKILLLASNGKVFTIEASKLPGGRGFGDPVRLMVDLDDGTEIVAALPYKPESKLLVGGSDGRGFIAPSDALVANTRKGKAILGLDEGTRAVLLVPAEGDHVAVCSSDKLMLVFPASEVTELGRGKGVRLQRCRQSQLADACVFTLAEGLPWRDGSGQARLANAGMLEKWMGHRSDAGTLMTRSFPKFERFGK
ncbi:MULTISPECIES: DNA topoisomerase IV subunit A [Methylorubrum]|jgi:topoisomerase-4 subunit A|uniref:DNA topoisomerase 4 subunit A n=2 Tax=Methylorubrum extorquens TaxID=408 RepID=C5AWB5_METEA|nr:MULTISPECIES: DNA topoisomerase IV subunit A [Methylorubrum]MBA9070650.1 topoisomerase-4 subunit A [Methylobacterium sp. RAS18]ACS38743.1 DNA topoisomerase IV subunitA [Methylorubrum extorquens AM1]EHP92350.1 DNA topoisomerase IV, A subunit [Methylorubrum extorquens DSM 13060]MCP1543185.1 topoisomerase-4 subunit A [Methylorubrum extorquens]MCP1589470.1 topoisomerase-4 subunit A [Methylorubrum extorquens]